jgi:hypothetical protein
MTISEGIGLLIRCGSDHASCNCGAELKALMPETYEVLMIMKALGILAHVLDHDWSEAIELNNSYDAGARGWIRDALIEKMKKADLTTYRRGSFAISMDSKETVKVRITDDSEPEEETKEEAAG